MIAGLVTPFRGLKAAFSREIRAYFAAPVAYVFITVFLVALGLFTWEGARFFDTGSVDLAPFFTWHPWLYMIFLPALAMRLWADERASGTDELLLSLPVSLPGVVLGKLLAAWSVAAVALLFTVPMWVTANILGSPDNIAIALTYLVSLAMAGAYLSIGAAASALTSRQVTAFVISVVVAFLFTAAGWPLVLSGIASLVGPAVADSVATFSFLTHFQAAQNGVLEGRALFFFASVIAVFLALNGLWAARRRVP
ncbi:MAG: ABC transporter permease subunit [Pseudomonadota bacterium]